MEEPVTYARFHMNTGDSERGYLTPTGLALGALTLDIFGLLTALSFTTRFYGAPEVKIQRIEYSNPIDIWAAIKGIPVAAVKAVAERALYFPQEVQRRNLENDSLREDVNMKELDRLAKALELRKQLTENGIDSELAGAHISDLLRSQNARISVSRSLPPQRRR